MSAAVAIVDTDTLLREAARRLAAAAPVEKVILFGSRARGDHTADSDFDLCVILDDGIPPGLYTPITLWQQVADLGIPIQIVALRRGAFEAARRDIQSISYQIDRDGRVIYQRADALAP
ncbi:nucleotidyltransferase domain-containing protein [Rhodopseudomonas palustris]|uniref:DNA polymerase, beta-like region n=1 Tax=Rhodopseudomonas palustris (strain BisB18) TaxID=316056 RepID=Q20WR3_RHOPB